MSETSQFHEFFTPLTSCQKICNFNDVVFRSMNGQTLLQRWSYILDIDAGFLDKFMDFINIPLSHCSINHILKFLLLLISFNKTIKYFGILLPFLLLNELFHD